MLGSFRVYRQGLTRGGACCHAGGAGHRPPRYVKI